MTWRGAWRLLNQLVAAGLVLVAVCFGLTVFLFSGRGEKKLSGAEASAKVAALVGFHPARDEDSRYYAEAAGFPADNDQAVRFRLAPGDVTTVPALVARFHLQRRSRSEFEKRIARYPVDWMAVPADADCYSSPHGSEHFCSAGDLVWFVAVNN